MLADLAADDVSVTIAGSGAADVRAERRLNVTIAGSGRLRHSGAAVPTVQHRRQRRRAAPLISATTPVIRVRGPRIAVTKGTCGRSA